jgi:hypothetical protein
MCFSLASFLSIIGFHEQLLNKPERSVTARSLNAGNTQEDISKTMHSTSFLSNSLFFQDKKAYDCTDMGPKYLVFSPTTEAPVNTCLGGKESWGRCDRGFFLCEQKLRQNSTALTIRFGTPFSFDCIDNVCKVIGFRYDPALTSLFCSPESLCFSCYASRENIDSDYFCQPSTKTESVSVNNDETILYIPHSSPLNSIVNGRDTVLTHEQDSIRLFAMTWKPDEKCAIDIHQTAILMFLDGTNPFHHLIMGFRRLFSSLVMFHVNSDIDELTDCVFVAWRGISPEHYYAKYHQYLNPLTNMTEFDGGILKPLCRGGLMVLSNRTGPVCFSKLLLGSTPGGWDMSLEQNQPAVKVNFAGVVLARLIVESTLGRRGHVAVTSSGLVLVVRRGRRELVNEDAVRLAIESSIAPAVVRVLNFDSLDFRTALELVSTQLVMVGVHGAALTNLIFLPPAAALVEVAISPAKNEYLLLSRSFGKRYYAHPHLIPTDTQFPDLRQRRVTVDRVPELGRLCATALSRAERLSLWPACC